MGSGSAQLNVAASGIERVLSMLSVLSRSALSLSSHSGVSWGSRTRERAAEPPQLAIWNVGDADAGNVHRLLAQILKEAPPAAEGAPPTLHVVAVSCADDVNLDDEAGVGSGLAVVRAV